MRTLMINTRGKLVWSCGPLSRVSTSQWSETISPLSVCLTTVSSTLLFYAVLSLPWHGWPHVHTWDKGRGLNNVPKIPFYIPETPVALSQASLRRHVHSTTYCVGTSWVDLLDVKIRHLPFNKACSTDPQITLDYIGFQQVEQIMVILK